MTNTLMEGFLPFEHEPYFNFGQEDVARRQRGAYRMVRERYAGRTFPLLSTPALRLSVSGSLGGKLVPVLLDVAETLGAAAEAGAAFKQEQGTGSPRQTPGSGDAGRAAADDDNVVRHVRYGLLAHLLGVPGRPIGGEPEDDAVDAAGRAGR